jgi:hypothetical protein
VLSLELSLSCYRHDLSPMVHRFVSLTRAINWHGNAEVQAVQSYSTQLDDLVSTLNVDKIVHNEIHRGSDRARQVLTLGN